MQTQYNQFKTAFMSFHDSHPGYVWFAMEFSMVCASMYSLYGLFLIATGALVSGSTLSMALGFLVAPIYALLLFAVVTVVLTAILTLPYLFFTRHSLADASASASRKPRKASARKSTKTAGRSRRTATAK